MPQRLSRIFLPLFLFGFFSLAIEARADTVVIANGYITFSSTAPGSFSVQGDGLDLHGITSYFYAGQQFPHISSTLSRVFVDDALQVASPFTVGGITYSDTWNNGYNSLYMNIVAQDFTFPTDPSITSFTIDGGFTMNGIVGVNSLQGLGTELTDITGQGFVSATYQRSNGTTVWTLQNLNYTFRTTTPTPEPATLLLLGTGLAGIAMKGCRRRKSRNPD